MMTDQLAPAKGFMLAFAICTLFWLLLLASCSPQDTSEAVSSRSVPAIDVVQPPPDCLAKAGYNLRSVSVHFLKRDNIASKCGKDNYACNTGLDIYMPEKGSWPDNIWNALLVHEIMHTQRLEKIDGEWTLIEGWSSKHPWGCK